MPRAAKPTSGCFCCSLQQNISQVSVVRLRFPGFSIGMSLRKQQRTWLFLAVIERSRPTEDRKCMAAGDYQFDSEIASRNSCSSNYIRGRLRGLAVSLPRPSNRGFGGKAAIRLSVKLASKPALASRWTIPRPYVRRIIPMELQSTVETNSRWKPGRVLRCIDWRCLKGPMGPFSP